MVNVRVDMQGNLIELLAMPDGDAGKTIHETTLFELAGYTFKDFKKTTAATGPAHKWIPPVYADRMTVYHREKTDNDSELWIFTAHHDVWLVYFYAGPVEDGRPVGRWFVPPRRQPQTTGSLFVSSTTFQLMQVIVLLASILLALRNLRLARVNRKGALRFAVVFGALQLLLWLFAFQHIPSLGRELPLLLEYLSRWIGFVFCVWLLYLALEPYVRRYWPDVLIAWTRVLNGRVRDPLLGRELLMGCAASVVAVLLMTGINTVARLTDEPTRMFPGFDPGSSLRLSASVLYVVSRGLSTAIWNLMVLFIFRVVFRDGRLAVAAFVVFWMGTEVLIQAPIAFILNVGIFMGGLALVITRCGLAAGAAFWFGFYTMQMFLIMPDVTAWYGHSTLVALGSIAAVALYGFYTSTLAPRMANRPGTS